VATKMSTSARPERFHAQELIAAGDAAGRDSVYSPGLAAAAADVDILIDGALMRLIASVARSAADGLGRGSGGSAPARSTLSTSAPTRRRPRAKGIYAFRFDDGTGALTPGRDWSPETPSPSF
jgi:hypothetical protein